MTRTSFILFGCCVVAWTMCCQLSHYLSPWHVGVFLGGLFVTFPALRTGLREGLWSTFLIGLLVDASAPVYFGFHAFVFSLVHIIVYNMRGRFPREETVFGVIAALLANLGLFLGISLALLHRSPSPLGMLPRLLIDLFVSELLVLVFSPWFFALQERALELCNVSLRREQRGLL